MGTRSQIIVRTSPTIALGSYCQFDGYLSNNGRLLVDHYPLHAQAVELVALGDLRSVGETLLSTHAYHRNGGEAWDGVAPTEFSLSDSGLPVNARKGWVEYLYYHSGVEWLWSEDGNSWRPLAPDVDFELKRGLAFAESLDSLKARILAAGFTTTQLQRVVHNL